MATCPKCKNAFGNDVQVCPTDGEGLLPDEAFANADQDLQPGDPVGEYVVDEKLGEGGFGAVFKATHPLIGKQVAIKVLFRQYSANPQMVSRFISEARAVNQIRHRNIIDIFAFGQLPDGRHYYVMEYLAGTTLDEFLGARGPVPLAEAVPILRSLARALDAAHAKGIAHRDLKPENIFLASDDDGLQPKLLDFGIAKLLSSDAPHQHKTRTGAPMGTPYYMSPEQCRGRDVDHRTDFYSFGVVAYQVLTGTLPFDGPDFMEILLKQLSEEAVPPSQIASDLPDAVDQGIAWLMQKDPAKRPPNLVTAMRAIEEGATSAGVVIPSATSAYDQQTVLQARTPDWDATTGPRGTAARMKTPTSKTPGRATPAPGSREHAAQLGRLDTLAASNTPATPGTSFIGGEAAPEASAASRRGKFALIFGAAGAVVAVAAVVIALSTRTGGEAKRDEPDPPPTTTAPAVQPPVAAGVKAVEPPPSTPLVPPTVSVEIQGPPQGTEVAMNDQVVGKAPGLILLPRGEAPVTLELRKAGYKTRELTVTPAKDLVIPVELAKATGHKSDGKRKDPKKKPDKDSIEDPFK